MMDYSFPVAIGDTLWLHNYGRHCIDEVKVVSLWISRDYHIRIGIENKYGESLRTRAEEDIGKSLFLTEEEAVCAFLANGGESV